ncbi:hypothetical protein LR48_Vigan635s000100 [Vigna angularis]|uniref:Uncharacterized protein n=1 Tax=Phaseolus angularis TaxID=3914 RepID=A0A0L9TF83_PHAAN|nr:hypothetical protein LR48_Vigan635s000100 [Vigna angularis]
MICVLLRLEHRQRPHADDDRAKARRRHDYCAAESTTKASTFRGKGICVLRRGFRLGIFGFSVVILDLAILVLVGVEDGVAMGFLPKKSA